MNEVARLDLTDSFRRAGQNKIADFKREILANVRNQIVKLENHLVCFATLTQLIVDLAPNAQTLQILNLLFRDERADRTTCIES
jgi:hypothetical protein